jgi:hypothetical protein
MLERKILRVLAEVVEREQRDQLAVEVVSVCGFSFW